MYHHMAVYAEDPGGAATNSDIDAVLDEVIQRRNSHLIFSEPFNLIASLAGGATLTRARFGNIALTVRGTNHLWPISASATIPNLPGVQDRRDMPLVLPMNEEITIEGTVSGAGQAYFPLWLAKPNWTQNLPRGLDQIVTRATSVVAAGTETTWTALAPLVFERDLFNGVYSVIGANVVAANAVAFRLYFPSQPTVQGRQLRPGGLVQNATGNYPWEYQSRGLGEWGRFHTFEPPSLQVACDAAGGTYEVRLDLVYLGADISQLSGGR